MYDEARASSSRAPRPLAVGYLVWHGVTMLAVLGLLLWATLAYAGYVSVATPLSPTASVLGLELPSAAVLAALWVAAVLAALAGLAFGVLALAVEARPGALGSAVRLGRAMLALCLVNLLLSFLQQSAFTTLAALISAGLTCALVLELGRFASGLPMRGAAPTAPKRSFLARVVEELPAKEGALDGPARRLFRLCSGYATLMLVWGCLRVLMGVSALFSLSLPVSSLAAAAALGCALVAIVTGAYLVVAGRAGKLALCAPGRLAGFARLCAVGVALCALALLVCTILFARGGALDAGDVFCVAADLAFFAAGVFYARRLSTQLAK